MNNLFQNHEIVKISLDFPVFSPFVIYFFLFMLSLYRRKDSEDYTFLCRQVTVDIRGLAILLVVVGHLGFHTVEPSQRSHFPILGQYGVSIFFLLSGFGLTRSYINRSLHAGEFIQRRLSRVMLPYWIVTILIVALDSIFLDKSYKVVDLITTMVGFNYSKVARSIDYVRWYVTVLLLWYMIFFLIWKIINDRKKRVVCFLGIGILLVFSNYYLFPLGYAYLSFPFGVLVGLYFDDISRLYHSTSRRSLWLISMAALMANWLVQEFFLEYVDIFMPTIGMAIIAEFSWLIVAFSLVVIGSLIMPYKSPFLNFFGKYSYAIFLLHGALMIKYDFILYQSYLFITIWVYFLVVLVISIFMEEFIFKKFI